MSVSLLKSIQVSQFLSTDEVDQLITWIHNVANLRSHVGDKPGDRFQGQTFSNNYAWNFYADDEWSIQIRQLLEPRFDQLFSEKQTVFHSHILESLIPYQLHTDYDHMDDQYQLSQYTILIPLETYDSKTVVFNEHQSDSNEFEKFKQHNPCHEHLQIDAKFCVERLSHLHPKDLRYLSLKETFDWHKGDLFAMDRRYFHCSDNFIKHGIDKKLGIVIWTGIPKQ